MRQEVSRSRRRVPLTPLLDGLGFSVLDRIVDPEEVLRALPWPAEHLRTIPRRLALAATIHSGDENEENCTLFALLNHNDKTLIAKPGGRFVLYGETGFDVALSKRFGIVGAFHSHDVCPAIIRYRGGECDGTISGTYMNPVEGIFGQTELIPEERCGDIMRVALARYVGAPWEQIFPRIGGTAELFQLV